MRVGSTPLSSEVLPAPTVVSDKIYSASLKRENAHCAFANPLAHATNLSVQCASHCQTLLTQRHNRTWCNCGRRLVFTSTAINHEAKQSKNASNCAIVESTWSSQALVRGKSSETVASNCGNAWSSMWQTPGLHKHRCSLFNVRHVTTTVDNDDCYGQLHQHTEAHVCDF